MTIRLQRSVVALLLACPAYAATPPAPAADGTAAEAPVGVAPTPANSQLAWVLRAFSAGGQLPDTDDLAAHFSPAFLEKVPATQLAAVFAQLSEQTAPLTLVRIEPDATETTLSAVVKSKQAGLMRILLSTEAAAPHRMEELLFQPAPDLAAPPASWEDLGTRISAVAPTVNLLAAEIGDGSCRTIYDVNSDAALALGSAFKLYTLSALAHDVERGELRWGDTLAVNEAQKSLPSGPMRDEPAGTLHTLQHFAEQMISVSDNTAADQLLFAVGREDVEAAVVASGSANAARNVPFWTTRELFTYKLLLKPREQRKYLKADLTTRREKLTEWDQRDLAPAMALASAWTEPRAIDTAEWFASADDLCGLALNLRSYTEIPETAVVSSILAINPGIPDANGLYKYIGFKGGSEPGVLNLTWLLQRRSDNRWFFLTLGFNDTKAMINQADALAVATAARFYLATGVE